MPEARAGHRRWATNLGLELAERVRGEPVDVRDGVVRCLYCHVTRSWIFRDPPPESPIGPEAADAGIGCERCHGPGGNHIAAVQAGFADTAIVTVLAANAGGITRQCGDCHIVDIPSEIEEEPEDPRYVRSPAVTLTLSRCYQESGGALSCVTCHDPHRDDDHVVAYHEAKCLTCHSHEAHWFRRGRGWHVRCHGPNRSHLQNQPEERLSEMPHAEGSCAGCPHVVDRPLHPGAQGDVTDWRRAPQGSIGSMSFVSVSGQRSSRRRRMTVLVIVTTVVAGALAVWLCASVAAAWDARATRRALAEGRLEDAAQAVERWLLSSPCSAEAHFYKARIAWAQNNLATTDVELARARALGYSWQPSNRLLGLLLARTNETTEAETLLRQAIEIAGKPDPEVADALVRIYLGTFRLNEAQEVLEQLGSRRSGRRTSLFITNRSGHPE